MEEKNRIDPRSQTSGPEVPQLICAIPFKLSLHGHPEQADSGAQHKSECECHVDIPGSSRPPAETSGEQYECGMQQYLQLPQQCQSVSEIDGIEVHEQSHRPILNPGDFAAYVPWDYVQSAKISHILAQ